MHSKEKESDGPPQKKGKSNLVKTSPSSLQHGYFKNLTHLDISGNSAEKLDLRSLSRLEWLCCANNNLEVLLLSGTSLTYLDCSCNNLLSISVDPVPNNLSTLQVSFNNLEDLPSWTWMVPELFTVHASHNRLRQLDCKFQNSLTSLPIRELQLHCNKIEFVSKDFIQRATRLKVLNLSRNLIEHMPHFGRKCPIQELYLSRNNLQDSDEKDALEFLTESSQLRRLYLGYNKIEQISDRCISAWKNLEELILCGNRIRSLPSKISSLTNLRVLRVHSNALETAPNFSKIPSLKMVDLSHNSLRKINLEHLISGGNLTYLDISCNERLSLNAEKLSTQNQRRPMNLVEVTNPRKKQSIRYNAARDFPANPPWEIGFSELPDRNLVLSVSQYRDVNIANGKEALFGIFDGGDGNAAPKYISKSIAKIYAEEKNIEETHGFSLKYTLLNAMKSIKQQGYARPLQGILCLLSTHEDNLYPGKSSFYLNVAMVGGIRCLLVESGKKVTRLTEIGLENQSSLAKTDNNTESHGSIDGNSNDSGSTKSGGSSGKENDLSGHIPDPKVVSIPLSTSSEFLVIGNQNVWNYLTEAELMEELETHRNKKSVLIAKRLGDIAQSHACKQSLSIIVVKFKWHSSSLHTQGLDKRGTQAVDHGPLSYYSGSSEYSEASNHLASVTTPDSAIDTDRSGSVGSNGGSTKSASTNLSDAVVRPRFSSSDIKGRNGIAASGSNRGSDATLKAENIGRTGYDGDDDQVSVANTSVSQMSVEQFKCWEYMLEQNTKLLFKKELDTLSKGVFQRNNKQRKSVHFPFVQTNKSNNVQTDTVQNTLTKSTQNVSQTQRNSGTSTSPTAASGFYSMSKAKSLTHLFGTDPTKKIVMQSESPMPENNVNVPKPNKSQFPNFGNAGSSGFLGSVRSSARRAILGGPNAAYFSSSQRQSNIPPNKPTPPKKGLREVQEIQEISNFDSIEHESRLKKYWENKITEL